MNSIVYGQGVYEAWVARYNGPGTSGDVARALAVDDSGYVYVTGGSVGSGSIQDYATIKFKPNGDTVWVRRYNGPAYHDDGAYAIAVDDSGFVYVTGQSLGVGTGYDYLTVKYRPNGETEWLRRYNGLGNSSDAASAIVVDKSGNVYVTGYSVSDGSGNDFATIKYDSNGDTLWVRRYNGIGNGDDIPTDFVVDDSGNVYVTGMSFGGESSYDYLTIKYSKDGELLWERRYSGGVDSWDIARAIVIDTTGYIYVTGSIDVQFYVDFGAIKYSPAGDTVWVRTYDSPDSSYDFPIDMCLDSYGNIVVTGVSTYDDTGEDFFTIKYSGSGDTLWTRRFAHRTGWKNEWPSDMVLDANDNIYITGSTFNDTTTQDYLTLKYSSEGNFLWAKAYANVFGLFGSGGFDAPAAIAVAGDSSVYVTGRSQGDGTGDDFATIKYSPCSAIPGDVNSTGDITLGDIIHVVNYIFDKDKLPCLGLDPGNCWTPELFCRDDINQTGTITIGDIVHLVNYIFDKDKLPCLGSDPGNCWTPVANGACCLAVP